MPESCLCLLKRSTSYQGRSKRRRWGLQPLGILFVFSVIFTKRWKEPPQNKVNEDQGVLILVAGLVFISHFDLQPVTVELVPKQSQIFMLPLWELDTDSKSISHVSEAKSFCFVLAHVTMHRGYKITPSSDQPSAGPFMRSEGSKVRQPLGRSEGPCHAVRAPW